MKVTSDLPHRGRQRHQMPSIVVVSGASSFGRYHGGPQGVLRCAFLAERRAIVRLFQARQHLPADADRRLRRVDRSQLENLLGVVIAKLVLQAIATPRDNADSTPGAVANLEHAWRGIGIIPQSGYRLKDEFRDYDAEQIF